MAVDPQAALDLRPRCSRCGQPVLAPAELHRLATTAQRDRARCKLAIPTSIDLALEAMARDARCRLGTCTTGSPHGR